MSAAIIQFDFDLSLSYFCLEQSLVFFAFRVQGFVFLVDAAMSNNICAQGNCQSFLFLFTVISICHCSIFAQGNRWSFLHFGFRVQFFWWTKLRVIILVFSLISKAISAAIIYLDFDLSLSYFCFGQSLVVFAFRVQGLVFSGGWSYE